MLKYPSHYLTKEDSVNEINESVKSEGDPNFPNIANGVEQNEVIFAQP